MGALREPTKEGNSTSAQPEVNPGSEPIRVLRVVPRSGFGRVPTHAVGVVRERRVHPRAALRLPLRLTAVSGRAESIPVTLVTQNISSSGVYFLCPRWIEPGAAIDLEVGLVEWPLSRANVRMVTAAHVVRVDQAQTPGWHGLAATFDDIAFQREETGLPQA